MNTHTNTPKMKLHILQAAGFACMRNCTPGVECLFGPVFQALGTTRVVSHTTRVDIEIRDKNALGMAVGAMGGRVLGEGTHTLYGRNTANGFGFNLPLWAYPLVLGNDNKLAYDTFLNKPGWHGDIKTLTGKYAIEVARAKASEEGWVSQDIPAGLMIYHPSGATMTVDFNGTVDANGFQGSMCDVTQALENAIGTQSVRENKDEYFSESANIRYSS